jgi:uncharacterized protein YkwD
MRHHRLPFRSLLVSIVALFTLSGFVGLAGAPAGAAAHPRAEFDGVWLINQTRGSYGLHGVGQDPWLTILARVQAERMAGDGGLSHQDLGVPLSWGWRWAGENVAYSSAGIIDAHTALVHSPPHLANILSGNASAVGVGIAFGGNRLYLTEVFAG